MILAANGSVASAVMTQMEVKWTFLLLFKAKIACYVSESIIYLMTPLWYVSSAKCRIRNLNLLIDH